MTGRTERLLWGSATIFVVVALVGWRAALPEPLPDRSPRTEVIKGSVARARSSVGDEALHVVNGDPFRLARRPAAVPFGAEPIADAPPAQRAPLPALRLTGILGPPWRAVVEGVLGVEQGTLVAPGDSVAGARIKSISADAVTLRTSDTTWTLTLRRPW